MNAVEIQKIHHHVFLLQMEKKYECPIHVFTNGDILMLMQNG